MQLRLSMWLSIGLVITSPASTVSSCLAEPLHSLSVDTIAHLSGPDRQKILVQGAREEGSVVLYTTLATNQALRPLVSAFEKKYPFIKFDFWNGGKTTNVLLKSKLEQESGAVRHDFFEYSGDGIMQAIESGIVQSFSSPMLKDYPATFYDAENGLWAGTRQAYYGLAYNTNLVAPNEVPRSYKDLLDPKWRGKMTWSQSETGNIMFVSNMLKSMGKEAGEDYIKQLSQQKILTFQESARSLLDQVGQGEYPIVLHVPANFPQISRELGAPLAVSMLEPVDSDIEGVQLARGAPHPYAAMLAIDFFLSREGQAIYRDANYFPGNPYVELKPDVRALVPRFNNMKQTIFSPELTYAIRSQSVELLKKYFTD